MAQKRELNLKPSFTHELQGFPPAQLAQLWEKIDFLQNDPLPDGKLKKKLSGKQDLYRLRLGDYRIFYTFGDAWIRLLALRRRDGHTYGSASDAVQADAPGLTSHDDDAALEEAIAGDDRPKTFVFDQTKATNARALPRKITAEWLSSLGVAAEHHASLATCSDEDALLDAPVPSHVVQRVVDNLFPRSLGEVLAQPDLVVNDTQDLVRFREGELIAFLLKLDPAQEKLTRWALKGPTLVKGGAGTGKSTVALYRVKALLERKGATGAETVLFTTYTRALEKATEQLLEQLLTPAQHARVRVATCDAIAREVVSASRAVGTLADGAKLRSILRDVRQGFEPSGATGFERKARAKALARIPDEYLLDEIEWVIDGRDLATLDDYVAAPRPGRGIVLGEKLRTTLWELAGAFKRRLSELGLETFADLRREALTRVRAGLYAHRWDHVLVDEAQDLSPASLSLLAELARTAEGVFLAADNKQSLYSRNYNFAAAHPRLDFKGRTALLTRNYRSTAEIDRAAFSLLHAEGDESLEVSESPQSGPLPVIARGFPPAQESRWAARFLRQMASHLHLQVHAGAVLVPDAEAGLALAQGLTLEGIGAKYFPGRELDLKAPVVKVLTLHSAKGLEFPTVVIAGLRPGTYASPEGFASPEEYAEAMRNHRRLLYVGMTRAMRGLLVLQPKGSADPCLSDLDPSRWNVQEAP